MVDQQFHILSLHFLSKRELCFALQIKQPVEQSFGFITALKDDTYLLFHFVPCITH